MRVLVTGGVEDLAKDLRKIATKAPRDMYGVVRSGVRTGNVVARDLARESSGKHAKLYPRAFSSEMKVHGLGGLYAGEYGPVPKGQGALAPVLENGSPQSPPHNNLARSADLMGPALRGEARRLLDKWFWPK